MHYIVLVISMLIAPVQAWAVYDDSTVTQVDPVSPQGTVSITATFSGAGEQDVKQSVVLPWNYTDDTIAEWSASIIERLNGTKTLPARIKAGDKLAVTRPVRPVSPIP